MGLRIIKPESLAFIAFVQLNAIDVEFFEVGVAVEQLVNFVHYAPLMLLVLRRW